MTPNVNYEKEDKVNYEREESKDHFDPFSRHNLQAYSDLYSASFHDKWITTSAKKEVQKPDIPELKSNSVLDDIPEMRVNPVSD